MLRKLSREDALAALKMVQQREMAIFDTFPKCVRDVINNSPVGIKPSSILEHAANVKMLQEDPRLFAQKLERHLDHVSKRIANVH